MKLSEFELGSLIPLSALVTVMVTHISFIHRLYLFKYSAMIENFIEDLDKAVSVNFSGMEKMVDCYKYWLLLNDHVLSSIFLFNMSLVQFCI